MKKFKLSMFLLCAVIFTGMAITSINCASTGTTNGSIGVNINDQPNWGPTGYDRADFYYIPDIDVYYSVAERQYIYRDGSGWIHAVSLPASYSGYDPYHSYKVVLNEDRPYRNNDTHRSRYGNYKGKRDQQVIRDSHDRRYSVNKDQPEHDNLVASVNISDQPSWGPTGYDRADYYYIPEINSYYSISERQYIYRDGSGWTHAVSLPASYSGYDPYNSYKVVLNEERPYQNNDNHLAKYATFKGMRDQPMIRDSHDRKYSVNKDLYVNDNLVVSVNISDQPIWGPTGYDHADYYYIPDIDAYYSVSERQYIFRDGSDWTHAALLPTSYRDYDPYHSYKVVVNEDKPYRNNEGHRARYGIFKGLRNQSMIRDSQEHKYWVIKDHPEHDNWVREQQH
jgi:rRNA maturation protein Nop10